MARSSIKSFRRRSSGLVRTLVVSVATLSILLVCYAMYLYTQVDPDLAAPTTKRSRIPSLDAPSDDRSATADPALAEGVPFKGGVLGPGRDVKLTVYAPEGTRARFDIEVQDWTPRPGSIDEFVLVRPRVRMRTRSGNAVRITAEEGIIEAQRQSGGSLDPRRGKLTGNVLIEYDRLTETQRASRGATQQIPPEELVRIEADEIQFDLEYAKVVVPGAFGVTAVEADFQSRDLEVRFNERENRVEWLRVAAGGRITLRGEPAGGEGLLFENPSETHRNVTFSQWLYQSLGARFATLEDSARDDKTEQTNAHQSQVASRPSPPPPSAPPASPDKTFAGMVVHQRPDGAFVFQEANHKELSTNPPVRYRAHFEQEIDVTQTQDGRLLSRLHADWLQLLRDVTGDDAARPRAQDEPTSSAPAADNPERPSDAEKRQVVLTWSGRLAVEAVDAGDNAADDRAGSKVSAGGAPVRLTHIDGSATCATLSYFPDDTRVELTGSQEHPVNVDSPQQGVITGTNLVTTRKQNTFDMIVTGPGLLRRSDTTTPVEPGDAVQIDPQTLHIAFDEQLTARGRFVPRGGFIRSGFSLSTPNDQAIDDATIKGNVRLTQRDVRVEADELTVQFTDRVGLFPSPNRSIQHVKGVGQVNMSQGSDRITCDQIDVAMIPNPAGGARPRTAIARGNVLAFQGQRTIRARDSLTVDFSLQDAPSFAQPTTDADISRGAPSSIGTANVAARRMRARGDVGVVDPAEQLDLHADALDCAISESGEIETAEIAGTDTAPATVRLGDLAVTGREILLNVKDETARVPGQGRLTIQSMKDLDGRPVKEPIPIAITWARSLDYRGRENRALFDGAVHATSRSATTFDCERLLVEFDDIDQPAFDQKTSGSLLRPLIQHTQAALHLAPTEPSDWPWFSRAADAAKKTLVAHEPRSLSAVRMMDMLVATAFSDFLPFETRDTSKRSTRVGKEPAYLLATGDAVALVTNVDPQSGAIESRARISGPKLSLNLRRDASKMLIEGPGDLLLEDYRREPQTSGPAASTRQEPDALLPAPAPRGLLSADADDGPSNTLIEWRQSMWYDFSIEQTRFEGDVELKFISGAALRHLLNQPMGQSSNGRSTFLRCDTLTVDFMDRTARRSNDAPRMGRLSAAGLRQFDANGSVRLQDDAERLNLQADQVIYERPRNLLVIYGSPKRKAVIVRQEPNKLPTRIQVRRMIYDLSTGAFSIDDPDYSGQ